MAIRIDIQRPSDAQTVRIQTDTADEAIAIVRLLRPDVFEPGVEQGRPTPSPTPPSIARPRRRWDPQPPSPPAATPAPGPWTGIAGELRSHERTRPEGRKACPVCHELGHDGRRHNTPNARAALGSKSAPKVERAPTISLDRKPDLPPVSRELLEESRRVFEESKPALLSWLKAPAPTPPLKLAPPEADGRVRICPVHEGRLSIARMQPNGRPVYMCTLGHETIQSMVREPRA